MHKACYPVCSTCWHILGHHNPKTRRYDAICHCGCTDWVPGNNLEYLEWCLDKKDKSNV